jgi:hypothetical protein
MQQNLKEQNPIPVEKKLSTSPPLSFILQRASLNLDSEHLTNEMQTKETQNDNKRLHRLFPLQKDHPPKNATEL